MSANVKQVIRRVVSSALVSGIVALFCLFLWQSRTPLLIERAKKVVEVPEWRNEKLTSREHYMWLSSNEFAYITGSDIGKPVFHRQTEKGVRKRLHPTLVRHLFDRFYEDFVMKIEKNLNCRGSLVRSNSRQLFLVLMNRADTREIKIDLKEFLQLDDRWENCWSQDGKTLYVTCLNRDVMFQIDPETGSAERLQIASSKSVTGQSRDCKLCGITKQGRLLIAINPMITTYSQAGVRSGEKEETFRFLEAGFGNESGYSRQFNIKTPFPFTNNRGNTGLAIAVPSRICDRLLIGSLVWRQDPISSWLHSKFPGVPDNSGYFEEAWVGKMDGSDMRLIGTMPMGDVNQEKPWAIEPLWSPDDRRISFIYGDGIYVVEAP